jgi:endonuclease/exonuclease/phosphatase family metal-dependent hydrolase
MRRLIALLTVTILVWGCASRDGPEAVGARSNDDTITVMTFNVRFASPTPPNAWPQRRPVLRETLRQTNPDLIGTQEGLYAQLKDIATDLAPDYEWIGLGRDGGSRGEFMAIYYRKDRFDPLEYDHFWLSDTPMVMGSTTWGHTNRRMVTWVRFLDRQTNQQFYFWNTHLDHRVQEAREKAATLIRQRVENLKTDLPIILVGDFNATAHKNKAYTILTEGNFFTDTYAGEAGTAGTFHNFTGTPAPQGRIDWILLRGNVKPVGQTEIIRHNANGQYPSDHFPVVAKVRVGG